MINDITKFLNLKDPNIELKENWLEKRENDAFIHCTLSYPVKQCPCCLHHGTVVKNGKRPSTITYLDACGGACYLVLDKQRFRCKHCHHTFTARTSLVEKNCFIALPVKQLIASYATDTLSEKKIAAFSRVSIHTVRRTINQFASTIRQQPTTLPTHLCFDEFKSTKSIQGKMSFIFCEAITHQVIDVVEDRRLSYLKAYFYRYSRQVRKKVRTISIDMYPPYIELIRQLFPNASIIIDRFHIVQALNRELNRYRVKWMNQIRYQDRRLYNKLKRYWKLFLIDEGQLVYTLYERYRLFEELTNTGNIVDELLNKNEQFKTIYHIVQNLREALKESNWEHFIVWLEQANQMSLPSGLKRVLRTFAKYRDYLKNTFDHPTLTNGPIEGINNKIKVLKRVAYGYRNYDHFRNRILLIARLYVSTKNRKETKQLKKVA